MVKDRDDSPDAVHGPSWNFSEAIDHIGLGPFQTRLVIVCGMGWAVNAMQTFVLTFVMEDIATTFELSSVSKGLIGSVNFFGMLVGAGFWSVYADKRGRRTAFVSTLACICVGGIFSALSPSMLTLCICRTLVGFGVGGNMPVTNTFVTEFLPTADRAKIICRVTGIFWAAGMIFVSLLGLILANVLGPGKEEAMWRWFLLVAALPTVLVAVAYRGLPESPRFLHVMGRHDEAIQVLEHVARTNGELDTLGMDFSGQEAGEGDTLRLRTAGLSGGYGGGGETDAAGIEDAATNEQEAENAEAEAGDVRELFRTPMLRRITLSLWVFWITDNASYYGVTFLLPRYFDEVSGGDSDFVYLLGAVVGLIFIPGSYASTWLCSERCLGRVGALKWSSYATAATFLLLATTVRVKALFAPVSVLALFVAIIPGTVKFVLTPEVYSTKYRAVGLGSTNAVTRLADLLAPVMAEVLYDGWGPAAPLLVFGPIMIIAGTAAGMIPVETAGRQLDDNSWDREEPEELSAAPAGA